MPFKPLSLPSGQALALTHFVNHGERKRFKHVRRCAMKIPAARVAPKSGARNMSRPIPYSARVMAARQLAAWRTLPRPYPSRLARLWAWLNTPLKG